VRRRRRSHSPAEILIGAALGLVGLAIAIGIMAILFEEEERTVFVDNRHWESFTSVRWDEYHVEPVCETEDVCTGFGDDRTCRSITECRTETRTTTHTRCTTSLNGDELPIVYPEIGCTRHWGDYVTHGITYKVLVHETDSDKRAEWLRFDRATWDNLVPGTLVDIKVTRWNWITEVIPKKARRAGE
jgi:hypothetical protein